MERQVIIMQGVSGSGKSTLARKLKAAMGRFDLGRCEIVSADDSFFSSGTYRYDPSKIGEAHDECFRSFLKHLVNEDMRLIIVDNTNTLAVDIAPYMRAASAFGWLCRVVCVACDVKTAAGRNDGRAPNAVVEMQERNLEHARYPAYWMVQTVQAESVVTDNVENDAITDLLWWPVLSK
jgi:dephospho-CoA kinase